MDKVDAAIDMLKRHNLWRRGDETAEMVDPTLLGTAIDVACAELTAARAELAAMKAQKPVAYEVDWPLSGGGIDKILTTDADDLEAARANRMEMRPLYAHPAPDLLAEAVVMLREWRKLEVNIEEPGMLADCVCTWERLITQRESFLAKVDARNGKDGE